MSGSMQSVERFTAKVVDTMNRMYTTRPILLMGAIGLSILLLIFTIVSATTRYTQPTVVDYDEVSETLPVPVTKPQPPTVKPVSPSTMEVNQSMSQQAPAPSSQTSASVQVNGKNVPLPASGNGTVHKKITSSDGSNKTSIDITVKSHSSSSNSSSLNLEIESNQSSEDNSE